MGEVVKVIGNRPQNYAHNSGFNFAQRAQMSIQSALSTTGFAADRWIYRFEAGAGTLTYRARQNNISPNNATQWCFHGECLSGSSTGVVQNHARQIFEKSEARKLLTEYNGQFSLGFWYNSNKTGNHGISVDISGGGVGFGGTVTTPNVLFNVPTSGVWQYVHTTFQVNGLTVLGGADNGLGMILNIGPTSGGGQTTWDNGNYFYLAQVQLNPGPRAFDWRLAGEDLSGDLLICQRYYANLPIVSLDANATGASVFSYQNITYPATMRATPTVTVGSAAGGSGNTSGAAVAVDTSNVGTSVRMSSSGAGRFFYLQASVVADAEF